MSKVPMSFRFSQETINRLDQLKTIGSEQAIRLNITELSITNIVENSIESYYLQSVDKLSGDPYLSRIELILRDLMKQYFEGIIRHLNDNHFETIKGNELIKVILNTLELPHDEASVRGLVYDESAKFEEIINEKLFIAMKKGG